MALNNNHQSMALIKLSKRKTWCVTSTPNNSKFYLCRKYFNTRQFILIAIKPFINLFRGKKRKIENVFNIKHHLIGPLNPKTFVQIGWCVALYVCIMFRSGKSNEIYLFMWWKHLASTSLLRISRLRFSWRMAKHFLRYICTVAKAKTLRLMPFARATLHPCVLKVWLSQKWQGMIQKQKKTNQNTSENDMA